MEQSEINTRIKKLAEFLKNENPDFEFKPSNFFQPRMMKHIQNIVKLGIAAADYKISIKEGIHEDPLYQAEIDDHTMEELIKRKEDIEEHLIIIREYTQGSWD